MRHQFGEEGAALQARQALGLGVVEVEEVAPHRIPERRLALLVAVADDLHHHGIGEALRMAGHEQQAAAGVEFGDGGVHQFALDVEAGQQAVAGEVVAEREDVDLVVDRQRPRGVYEGLVAEAVEGFGKTGGGDYRRAARQAAGLAVFEDEEVALFAVVAHFGGEGCLGGADFLAENLGVVRQGSHTHGAIRGQPLDFSEVGHLRGAHHQHGVTPFSC
ncbi:hypothetical protein D3C78_1054260 [compost metagenome]